MPRKKRSKEYADDSVDDDDDDDIELISDNCTNFNGVVTIEDFQIPSIISDDPISLQTLSAITVANYLNFNVASPNDPEHFPTKLLNLPTELILKIAKFLHYRFLKFFFKKLPDLRPDLKPLFPISKRREEDLLRTRDGELRSLAKSLPLINIYESLNSFQWRIQDHSSIFLQPCGPQYTEYEGMLSMEDRMTNTKIWKEHFELMEGTPSVVTQLQFKKNWKTFTLNQLEGLNWKNILAAGGSVTACLLPKYSSKELSDYYEHIYETSDVDLFLYGLDQQEAQKKIEEIFTCVKSKHSGPVKAVKTPNTITIYSKYPYRCIQINTSMYASKAEILGNFDMDCVCVGYDGEQVWCLPRARDSLNSRTNIINGGLAKVSFIRVDKYRSRGFQFALPQFLRVSPFTSPSFEQCIFVGSLAKMKLLTEHSIKFEHDTNISKWLKKEWAIGVTSYGDKRAPIDHDTLLIPESYQKTALESEGSCGSYRFKYNKEMLAPPEFYNDVSADSIDTIPNLWKNDSEEVDQKWFGAPDFRDWDVVYGTLNTDFVQLEYIPYKQKLDIELASLPLRYTIQGDIRNFVLVAKLNEDNNLLIHFEEEETSKGNRFVLLSLVKMYGNRKSGKSKPQIKQIFDSAHIFGEEEEMTPIDIWQSSYSPNVYQGRLLLLVNLMLVNTIPCVDN